MTELFSWKRRAQVRYYDAFILLQKFRAPDPQLPIFSQKIVPLVGLMLCVVILEKQEGFSSGLLIPLYLHGVQGHSSPKPAFSISLSVYLLLQEALCAGPYLESHSCLGGQSLPQQNQCCVLLVGMQDFWQVFWGGFFLGGVCVGSQCWKIPRLF